MKLFRPYLHLIQGQEKRLGRCPISVKGKTQSIAQDANKTTSFTYVYPISYYYTVNVSRNVLECLIHFYLNEGGTYICDSLQFRSEIG